MHDLPTLGLAGEITFIAGQPEQPALVPFFAEQPKQPVLVQSHLPLLVPI